MTVPLRMSPVRWALVAVGIALTILLVVLYRSARSDRRTRQLVLGTTTSAANTGLLDRLLPDFERQHRCRVKVVALGSGQVIAMAKKGDVDVLLAHAPEDEERFVAAGFGERRTKIMYNQFVIAGPRSDPARVKGRPAVEALKAIRAARATFVSRGDASGTHQLEQQLWARAGLDYARDVDRRDQGWYRSTGSGMGDCLTRASELQGYVLTDEGTYRAYQGKLALEVLVTGDPQLLNQYRLILVSARKHPHVQRDLGERLLAFLTSRKVQARIGDFTVKGFRLFTPNAPSAP
jgi:tungstate transport system substrate-binding protein